MKHFANIGSSPLIFIFHARCSVTYSDHVNTGKIRLLKRAFRSSIGRDKFESYSYLGRMSSEID